LSEGRSTYQGPEGHDEENLQEKGSEDKQERKEQKGGGDVKEGEAHKSLTVDDRGIHIREPEPAEACDERKDNGLHEVEDGEQFGPGVLRVAVHLH